MASKQTDTPTDRDFAVCTAVSKNYIPSARVLCDSLRKYDPTVPVYVLLVDRVDGEFNPAEEPYSLVEVEELENIPNRSHLFFKYNLLELNTAVKPYFFAHLFRKEGIKRLLYFDPDIMILDRLDEMLQAFTSSDILLTPHIMGPYDDECRPSEIDLMQAGVFNLGFIGMQNTEETGNFLRWWQDRLYNHCTMEPDKGIHVDQKWIDLVPHFYEGFQVLRDPGYNVAYWNLHNRDVRIQDGSVTVNGGPLRFFHFSGFSPNSMVEISKHQNRFSLYNVPHLRPLFDLYRNLLLAKGYRRMHDLPYAFDRYDNGEMISEEHRRLYRQLEGKVHAFGDPFRTAELQSFYRWLHEIEGEVDGYAAVLLDHGVSLNEEMRIDIVKHNLGRQRTTVWDNTALAADDGAPVASRSRVHSGVNITGYLTGDFGVGEAGRLLTRAVDAGGVPTSLRNIEAPWYPCTNRTFGTFSEDAPYPVNIVCVNADMVPSVQEKLGSGFFAQRYNIGTWFWELSTFPEKWNASFSYFQEIWVASRFSAEALSRVSPVPVIKITYPIVMDLDQVKADRRRFGLEADPFVFLSSFDFHSLMERKNPFSLIEAFTKAFRKDDNALLLLKTINSQYHPDRMGELNEAIAGANVRILDGHLPEADMHSLYATADCYVSLHRCEGFGIPLAKSMLLGKPVIATGYSGNMDFMNLNNSFPVRYRLVELRKDYGPYEKGNVWAEPEKEHAAELMRTVYEEPDTRLRIGSRASSDILLNMCPEAAYASFAPRLERHFPSNDGARAFPSEDLLAAGPSSGKSVPRAIETPVRPDGAFADKAV